VFGGTLGKKKAGDYEKHLTGQTKRGKPGADGGRPGSSPSNVRGTKAGDGGKKKMAYRGLKDYSRPALGMTKGSAGGGGGWESVVWWRSAT